MSTMSKCRSTADPRKTNSDSGPFTDGTADGDRSAVFFDDFLDAGETQPDTRALRGEEGLKDFVDEFVGDRNTVVLNKNLNFQSATGTMLRDLDMKMAAGRHCFGGVPENAQERLLELGLIAAHRRDDIGVVLGDLNAGRLKIGADYNQCALKYLRNPAEMAIELKWFGEVENFIENGFDPDQITHGIFDSRLWIEVENPFTGDFLQLRSNRGQRFTDICR